MSDADALPCGCRWRRDERYGDVIDQCDEHRAETERRARSTDAALAATLEHEARSDMDRELDRTVLRIPPRGGYGPADLDSTGGIRRRKRL